MKIWKVYEIRNSLGVVEHVGETSVSLENRFARHTRCKPGPGRGKFYYREDVTIYEIARFNNRKDARDLEEQLQIQHGLETDRQKSRNNASVGGKISGPNVFRKLGKSCRKLTFEQATEIRLIWNTQKITRSKLARMFNTTLRIVSGIVANETYLER
jgi:hypothetical protein